jgi:hypothetical protein
MVSGIEESRLVVAEQEDVSVKATVNGITFEGKVTPLNNERVP